MEVSSFFINLITVILGSGASFSLYKVFVERNNARKESSNLMAQIAVKLEGYAIECAEKLSQQYLYNDSKGHAGKELSKIPNPPCLSIESDHKLIKTKLFDQILQFPQEHNMASREASFYWDVLADEDCCNVSLMNNTIKIGDMALELATLIRDEYRLSKRRLVFGEWDIRSFFKKERQKIEENTR